MTQLSVSPRAMKSKFESRPVAELRCSLDVSSGSAGRAWAAKAAPGLKVNEDFLRQVVAEVAAAVLEVAPGSATVGRIKTREARASKAIRYARDGLLIRDEVGVRVIVEDQKQCFAVAKRLSEQMTCLQEFYDDYIRFPKKNGYQSLHLAVVAKNGRPFEVQVRTGEMHVRAERGSAAHHLYKDQQLEGEA